MIHHGTSDDSCPIRWSRATVRALEREGRQVRFHVYEGEEHAFVPQWPLSMQRTAAFLDRHLTGERTPLSVSPGRTSWPHAGMLMDLG